MSEQLTFREWQLAHTKKHAQEARNARLRVRWCAISLGATTRSFRKLGDAINQATQALIKLNSTIKGETDGQTN